MPKVNRKSQTFFVASWAAVVIMLIVIFWFSAQDGTTLNEDLGGISAFKAWLAQMASAALGQQVDVSPIGHFTEYLLLGATLENALSLTAERMARQGCAPSAWRLVVLTTVLSSAYGVSDEFHQIFTPGRSCDPADWLVDTIAALIGSLVIALLLNKTKDTH